MRGGRLLAGAALLGLLVTAWSALPSWLFTDSTPAVDPWAGAPTDSLLLQIERSLSGRPVREARLQLGAGQLQILVCRPGDRVRLELRAPRLVLNASVEFEGEWWNLVAQFEGRRHGLTLEELQLGGRTVPGLLLPGLWDQAQTQLSPRFRNLLRNLRDVEVVADSVLCGISSRPTRAF